MGEIAHVFTRKQLAEKLGVGEKTLAEWEKAGCPVVGYGRKVRLYELEAVVAWMKRKKREGLRRRAG